VRYARGFGRFWYDFIVGDDWTVAVGVIVSLAATWLLAHAGVPAWWVLPLAVAVLLVMSLRRASTRRAAAERAAAGPPPP
jgi:membrane protein implicated in regulation of membrane protease activity